MSEVEIDWASVLGNWLQRLPGGSDRQQNLKELDAAVRSPPKRALRLSPRCPGREALAQLASSRVAWYPELGRVLEDATIRPGGLLNHAAGDYYVQDAGSMLALRLCDAQPDWKVLDCCASPGGKSTGILEQLGGSGVLVANEVIRGRIALLQMALERAGYGNSLTTSFDLDEMPACFHAQFECVLVDAPCSGQSMVVKGKQSSAAFSIQHMELNAARQRRLIRAASKAVAPGGRLVYSTCTFATMENESIIRGFLEEHPGWTTLREQELAQWEDPKNAGCYRIWPHTEASSGAFAAALVAPELPAKREFTGTRTRKSGWNRVNPHELDLESVDIRSLHLQATSQPRMLCERGLRRRGRSDSDARRGQIHSFPEVQSDWLQPALAGTLIAEVKARHTEPQYGLARLQQSLESPPMAALHLSDEQAQRFVEGQSLRCASTLSGWQIVWWQGRPLGWGKIANGVVKNHFPKPMRQSATLIDSCD
jgi:16S rRNA C967 or C1407 C5-methylase (RsmB/RsmF family)/NOL1/NOP2/fmu family ribosome biogenesis protein